MRILTLWRCVELSEKLSWSENIRSYGLIGCVTLILWWPLWWLGQLLPQSPLNAFIWKATFYANLFAMWVSWVILYQVQGRGMRLEDDATWVEVLKSLVFLVAMLFIMDLPMMLSSL